MGGSAYASRVSAISPPAPTTVGELRASGHVQKSLRAELRDNLLAALREGRDPWPGLHGFETTVIPQLERALLAVYLLRDQRSAPVGRNQVQHRIFGIRGIVGDVARGFDWRGAVVAAMAF